MPASNAEASYYMKFPVFAVEWGQNRESRIGKRGFFVVAGGGGSTKSGIQNGLSLCQVAERNGKFELDTKFELTTGSELITQVDVSPQGNLVAASVGKQCELFRLSATGLSLHRVSVFQTDESEDPDNAQKVARFAPAGDSLATAGDEGDVRLWSIGDAGSGRYKPRMLQCMRGHTKTVSDLCFNSSGSLLVSISRDTTCRVWRVNDGHCLATLPCTDDSVGVSNPPRMLGCTCRFSPADPGTLFTVQTAVRGPCYATVWKMLKTTATNTRGSRWRLHKIVRVSPKPVARMAVSADGQHVAFAGSDGHVHVMTYVQASGELRPLSSAPVHDMPITGIFFLPRSHYLGGGSKNPANAASDYLVTGSADYRCSVVPIRRRPLTPTQAALLLAVLIVLISVLVQYFLA